MRAWLSRSQILQRPGLAVAGVALGIIAVLTMIFSSGWLSSRSDDRVAVIGNFLSLGTFLLALAAGVVALAAYSAATGLPVLRVKIWTPISPPNDIRVFPDNTSQPIPATIIVRNGSKFAARTPAVIVQFVDCAIQEQYYLSAREWTPIVFTPGWGPRKILAVQWDGGPNYAIHGDSERRLPDLDLRGLIGLPPNQNAFIRFRLLADGYTYIPKTDVPVTFVAQTTDPSDEIHDSDSDWL